MTGEELKAAVNERVAEREELDRLRAEIDRLRRFVADMGQTCWPCEKCGHATSGKCLHCELAVLQDVLSRIRQWDHLDTASDGAYWKAEIDKVLPWRVRDVYDLSDMDEAALADLERIRREGGAKLTPEGEPQRRRDAEDGREC